MENPSQTHYTIEELFMLKPEITDEMIENSKVAIESTATVEVATTDERPNKNAFWSKYKWYIIVGSVVIIAGAGWYFYNENKKKKKIVQKN